MRKTHGTKNGALVVEITPTSSTNGKRKITPTKDCKNSANVRHLGKLIDVKAHTHT